MIPLNFPEEIELKTKIRILFDESTVIADQIQSVFDANSGSVPESADELATVHKLYEILCRKNREINRLIFRSIGLELN